jgi:hypothetical protein
MVSESATQRFVLALKRMDLVKQIENNLDAREVNTQDFPEPVDHAQPRDVRDIEVQYLVFLANRMYQPELHKSLGEAGMYAGARRQHIER